MPLARHKADSGSAVFGSYLWPLPDPCYAFLDCSSGYATVHSRKGGWCLVVFASVQMLDTKWQSPECGVPWLTEPVHCQRIKSGSACGKEPCWVWREMCLLHQRSAWGAAALGETEFLLLLCALLYPTAILVQVWAGLWEDFSNSQLTFRNSGI